MAFRLDRNLSFKLILSKKFFSQSLLRSFRHDKLFSFRSFARHTCRMGGNKCWIRSGQPSSLLLGAQCQTWVQTLSSCTLRKLFVHRSNWEHDWLQGRRRAQHVSPEGFEVLFRLGQEIREGHVRVSGLSQAVRGQDKVTGSSVCHALPYQWPQARGQERLVLQHQISAELVRRVDKGVEIYAYKFEMELGLGYSYAKWSDLNQLKVYLTF